LKSRRPLIALFLLPAAAFGVDFTFEIPPLPVTVEIGSQRVSLMVAGDLSASPTQPSASDQSFNLNMRADLGDLQTHLTPLLQSEINRSERCGERISVQNATLTPAEPAAHLAVQLHFEKWICIKAIGDSAKKLLAADGTVNVVMTPRLEETASGKAVRLDADIGTIEAGGPLGELLRSGTVGTVLRDKIRDAFLKAIQKSTDLDGVMPAEAKRFVSLQSITFVDGGFGRLALDITGQLKVSGEQVSTVLEQFGNR